VQSATKKNAIAGERPQQKNAPARHSGQKNAPKKITIKKPKISIKSVVKIIVKIKKRPENYPQNTSKTALKTKPTAQAPKPKKHTATRPKPP
jgi:hypothetical protein